MSFGRKTNTSSVKGRQTMEEKSEMYLECKAAFLSVLDDITDRVKSKDCLVTVLEQSGRNPTSRNLAKYWTEDTDYLTFDDFVDICRKEPVTTADDLMKAFRKIDTNGDGYISLEELYKIMTQRGEKMSRDEVRKLIDSVDDNKDGRLDYREFSNMLMNTTSEVKKMSLKIMEKKEKKKKGREGLKSTYSGQGHTDSARPGSASSHRSQTEYRTQSGSTSSSSTKKPEMGSTHSPKSTTPGVSKGSTTSTKKNVFHKVPDTSRTEEEVEEDIAVGEDGKSTGRPTPRINLRDTPREGDPFKGSTLAKDSPKREDKSSKPDVKWKDETGSKVNGASLKGSTKEKQEGSQPNTARDDSGNKFKHDSKLTASKTEDENVKKTESKNGGKMTDFSSDSNKFGSSTKESKETKEGMYGSSLTSQEKGGVSDRSTDTFMSSVMEEIFKTSARSEKSIHFADILGSPKSDTSKPGTPKPETPKPETSKPETPKSDSGKKPEKSSSQSSGIFGKIFGSKEKVKETPRKDETQDKSQNASGKGQTTLSTDKEATPRKDQTPQATPRKDGKMGLQEEIDSRLNVKKKENGMGSQSSFRSGEKDAPVPSPRKSVPKPAEDNLPKPSPRVRTSAGTKGKLPEPKNLKDWHHSVSKGCFFYEDDEIVTHQFKLRLLEDTSVYMTAQPIKEPSSLQLPSDEPVDTALYLLDRSRKLVAFSESRDVRGKYALKCDLTAGEYIIVPYTTGCRFKQSSFESTKAREVKLIKKDRDDKVVITTAFRKALEDIFELCDLDGNGSMSKDEFNWFNVRTSGEELGDDEWEVVEEKTELVNGEISKEGFIGLNEMEAEDADGDVEDLWITLTSMGFNKALVMDEACPYRLDVYVEQAGRRTPTFKVIGIESLDKSVETQLCQSVMEATEAVKIRNMKDLFLYTYKNEHRATFVLDNRSRSTVSVNMDCSRSRNVVSNRGNLIQEVEVEPQSTVVAHHLLPKNEDSDWSVQCTETIMK